MKINPKVLQQLYPTFEVAPVSTQPGVTKAIQANAAIKAPAKYEPILTGAGYEFSDEDNAYHAGDQTIYYFDPGQMFLWVWAGVLYRTLKGSERLAKWVQGDEKYPEGKANTFMGTYKQMTGQGEEGGGVAVAPPGEEENEPEQDLGRGAGGSTTMHFTGTGDRGEKYADKPIDPTDALIMKLTKKAGSKKTLPSDLMIDLGMQAKKDNNTKMLKFLGTIKPLNENVIKQSDLNRLIREITQTVTKEVKKKKKGGESLSDFEKREADQLKKQAQSDKEKTAGANKMPSEPPPRWTKNDVGLGQLPKYGGGYKGGDYQEPETPAEEKWVTDMANKIWKDPMDIGNGRSNKWRVARTAQAKSGETVYKMSKDIHFTDTRFIIKRGDKWYYLDQKDDHTKHWTEMPEQPPVQEDGGAGAGAGAAGPGGMSTTSNVSPVTTPKAFKKQPEEEQTLDEMTTTGSGTTGYNVPGAFSRKGGSKAGVAGSAALGYTLTNVGKKDMELKGDKLYESIETMKKNLRKMLDEGQGLGSNFDKAQRAYDAQEPPSDHDCKEDGHQWKKVRSKGDVTEYKCKICGKTEVD